MTCRSDMIAILIPSSDVTDFSETASFADGPSSLKLSDLLTEAERANPMLAARRSAYEAAKERIPQAGAFDNPMIGIGVQSVPVDTFAFNREDMTGKMLELSQAVPFFGKRELRRQAARYEAAAVEAAVAGRTDTGVHALANVVSADVDGGPPAERAAEAVNVSLPEDLSVVSAEPAPAGCRGSSWRGRTERSNRAR